jgi:hypothetical protein
METDEDIIAFHKTDASESLVRVWNLVTGQDVRCYGEGSPVLEDFDEKWSTFVSAAVMLKQIMQRMPLMSGESFPAFDAWAQEQSADMVQLWRDAIVLYTNFWVSSGDVSLITGMNRGDILRNFLDWGIPPYEPPMTDRERETTMAQMHENMEKLLAGNEEARE